MAYKQVLVFAFKCRLTLSFHSLFSSETTRILCVFVLVLAVFGFANLAKNAARNVALPVSQIRRANTVRVGQAFVLSLRSIKGGNCKLNMPRAFSHTRAHAHIQRPTCDRNRFLAKGRAS